MSQLRMTNLLASGADPFAMDETKIPDYISWGDKLEKDKSIEEKVSQIVKFGKGERLRYHYHNVWGSSSFHIHHCSYHCVIVTDVRLANIMDGKVDKNIEFANMTSVVLAKKRGVLWDKVVVTLTDGSTSNISVSTEEAAVFFCAVVNRILEGRKQKLLDEKQRKIIRSMKPVSQPGLVHDPAGHKSSMEYINESVNKHQRFSFLPKEKIELHCANLLRKVKLSTHAHLSTSNCILKTNMRLIKMDQGNLICAHLLSRLCKIDLVPMHFLRFTRLHTHFFNGMTDTIKIGDGTAARFFARALQNMILTRACASMEANKKHVSKASVQFNFDDNESFYIISEVRGTQTLVLDHRQTVTETGPVNQLILSHISGQKSQKWMELDGKIVPLLVYESLKAGHAGCPPTVVDWVYNCNWRWNNYDSGDAIAQVGHVLQNFYTIVKRECPAAPPPAAGSKADLQEGQYLNEEQTEGSWIVKPSSTGGTPFLFDEQQPQRELFLTIMGTCCQHPQCERDNIVPGSFVCLAPPQHDKNGKPFLNKMQQWQRATDFEMFVDEMLNPLIDNLTRFREAQNDRCDDALELDYASTYEPVWGGNCYEAPFSIWDLKRDAFRMVSFGHACCFGSNAPTARMPIGKKELIGKIFEHPTSFELMWTYTPPKRLAKLLEPVYVWRPKHTNPAFAALGCVCTLGPTPALTSVVCVKKSYLRLAAPESLHSICVVDDGEQDEEEHKYVPLFGLTTAAQTQSDNGLLNSSFVFQGLLRLSKVSPSEAEKAPPGLVILAQDKLLCFVGDKAEGAHTEVQLTMTTGVLKQDSESKFFQVDNLWFAAKDSQEKAQWTRHLDAVLEALHPSKSVVQWTLHNSLWYVDDLRTFWVVSGHTAPGGELYQFKITPAEVAEAEKKMVAEGATLLVHATNELLSLIQRRSHEGDASGTAVDENILSNTFFQITELLQVVNNFLALVEQENLKVNSELRSTKMSESKERLSQAKDLIKRYIYRNVCAELLDLKERLRRLNSVWPILDLFACSDKEVASYRFSVEPVTAQDDHPRPLRSYVTGVLRQDIKKHVERLWAPSLAASRSSKEEKPLGDVIIPGFMIAEEEDDIPAPKKKTIAEIVQQVQGEVKTAFDFLVQLCTSTSSLVPELVVMCAEVIHVMIYTHLQENIEPKMLSVQAAVKLIEWLGHYETNMRKIVKSDPAVLVYILGQLSRLVDGYMDAYIEAGQTACLKWVRQILEREEKEPPKLEEVKGRGEYYHGLGPCDLFINVNQVFDLAVNTHKFRGIALERQSEMLLQILTFYNQYQQRNLDRSFQISPEIVTDPAKPEKFLIAGRPFTHAWVLAQANDVARYVELTEKFQETARSYLTPEKNVKMNTHLDDGFEALTNSFQETGSSYVDILKVFVEKYVRLACARFFTEAWFADRETVWTSISEDLDNCLDKFVNGVESEVYCRLLAKSAIQHTGTFYFLAFIENLKLIRAKCAVTESSPSEFFERITADKAAFLSFWDQYRPLIEETRFKILATEGECFDLLQTMFDCDEDFMQIHLEAVQKRFGRNSHVTPTRVVTAILTLKEVPRPAIEALVAPWKTTDTFAAGKAAGYDLMIRVEKGRNLVSRDSNGKSDPYVVVKLKDAQGAVLNSRSTQVIPETLDPIWNCTLAGYSEVLVSRFDSVLFEVYDKDLFTSDFMGQASLSFVQIQGQLLNKQWRTELTLAPKTDKKQDAVSGSIVVTITYGRKDQLEAMKPTEVKEEEKPPVLLQQSSDGKTKEKKGLFSTTFHFGSAKPQTTEKSGGFFSAFKRDKDQGRPSTSTEPPPTVEAGLPTETHDEPAPEMMPRESEGDDKAEMAKFRQAAKESHIQQFREARVANQSTPTKTAEPGTFFLDRRK